jgi:hypothetical protein
MTDMTPMHPPREDSNRVAAPTHGSHTPTMNRRDVLQNAMNGDAPDESAVETLCDWLGGVWT